MLNHGPLQHFSYNEVSVLTIDCCEPDYDPPGQFLSGKGILSVSYMHCLRQLS